jgi:hypothetical protein
MFLGVVWMVVMILPRDEFDVPERRRGWTTTTTTTTTALLFSLLILPMKDQQLYIVYRHSGYLRYIVVSLHDAPGGRKRLPRHQQNWSKASTVDIHTVSIVLVIESTLPSVELLLAADGI